MNSSQFSLLTSHSSLLPRLRSVVNQRAGRVRLGGQGSVDCSWHKPAADDHLQAGKGAHHAQGLLDLRSHAAGHVGGMACAKGRLQRLERGRCDLLPAKWRSDLVEDRW